MSRIFCLALLFIYSFCSNIATASSFLEEPPVRKDQVKNVLEHEPVQGEPLCRHTVHTKTLYFCHSPHCHQITGPIEATLCDYEIIESINELLYTHLHELVQTPFFRYFQVGISLGFSYRYMSTVRLIFIENVPFGLRMAIA